jgi:threonine aldolase
MKKTFASDNYAGILPGIIEAIAEANLTHESSYGYDTYTKLAKEEFQKLFGDNIEVTFAFNGTGANVLGISCVTKSFNSIFCSQHAHAFVDESTAPETFTGCRLFPLPTDDNGKISAHSLEKAIIRKGDEHHPQPRVLTISQPTEYGTLYTIDELKQLSSVLKKNDMVFHVDGARFFNALAAMNCTAKEMITETGVDILSVGGTKAGLMIGEAIVFLNPLLAKDLKYRQKQSMQLASKMRFISVQFYKLLKDELWKPSATHANRMAGRLASGLKRFENVQLTKPAETNAVFVIFPEKWIPVLQEYMFFYMWKDATGEARLMCSFDTTEEEVDGFIEQVGMLASKH